MPKRSEAGRKCSAHTGGVPVDAPPFFHAGCKLCEAKKAAGKVTGLEPPLAHGWKRIKDNAPHIDWEKRRAIEKKNVRALAYDGYRGSR